MKFEEFKKYKMLVESNQENLLVTPEVQRVYQWMEETGRIDEGIWSAIWSWLKRNLSPTSRKIYALAEEYEKELIAEYRAEYGKLKYKDLDSKFRRSWAGRIAEDIETKMNLIAGDDKDYRELVSVLVNQKKLKVKKQTLKELEGKMDPEYSDDPDNFFSNSYKDIDNELENLNTKEKNALSKVNTENPDILKKGAEALKKIISGDSIYRNMGYDNISKIETLIQRMIVYQKTLKEKGLSTLDIKDLEKTMKKFAKFVVSSAKKIESSKVTKEESLKIIAKITEKLLTDEKADIFEKMESIIIKTAEKEVKPLEKKEGKSKEDSDEKEIVSIEDIEKEVTGPITDEILEPDEVKNTIKTATKEADSESLEDIIDELDSSVKDYFEDNKNVFLKEVSSKVEKFNLLPEKERKDAQGELDYSLDSNGKLLKPTDNDIKVIYKNLLKIAGSVVSYYMMEKGKRSKAFYLSTEYLFEIYAIKKDPDGEFTKKNLESLLKIIKEKN